jgi:sucrose phosphorylase
LDEIDAALGRPVVGRIVELVRLRNMHPAFDGDVLVETEDEHSIRLRWHGAAAEVALEVDFASGRASIVDQGRREPIAEWS